MKYKIGDKVLCIKDLHMEDDNFIEFSIGKVYEIDDIINKTYYLIDNSGHDHGMEGHMDEYFVKYKSLGDIYDTAMGIL